MGLRVGAQGFEALSKAKLRVGWARHEASVVLRSASLGVSPAHGEEPIWGLQCGGL